MSANPEPQAACNAVIRKHSNSFSLAARLLPLHTRRNATALYAWCRHCDDAVDNAESAEIARRNLILQRENLAGIYANERFADPVLVEFQRTVLESRIPKVYAEHLLDGMQFDLECGWIETPEDLLRYCYRVAGTVGLMMTHVLGVSNDVALKHAAHLGMAMQLTNVCRDVQEDAHLGRCYLPAVWLNGSDPTTDEVARPILTRLLFAADTFYTSGDAGLKYLSPRVRWAIALARSIYSAIGRKIAQRDYRVSLPRAFTSKTTKALLVLWAARYALSGPVPTRPPEQLWTFDTQECLSLLGWDVSRAYAS